MEAFIDREGKMYKILIIEDDAQISIALKLYFEKNGYQVIQAVNCQEAGYAISKKPNIILADIGLPDGSGIELYKRISKWYKIPAIFLTARDEEEDILQGYDAGCEEYVTKPVSPQVLLRKIEVILKRTQRTEHILLYAGLKIDYDKKRVWYEETEIRLTPKEWKILELLSENKGRIVTKELLLEKIWDAEGNFAEEHVVSVSINRLRKKIEKNVDKPIFIRNIFGLGYTFGD